MFLFLERGFPDSSVDKESTCNAGDLCSIPGSGRSAGEGIGYPLQYSWASLVAQLVKNPPAMWRLGFDPWVRKMPWRRERLPTPVFWPEEFHGLYSPWGQKESDTTEQLSLHFKVKVSASNVGNPGFIPGSGRSPGEGNGNPLQYSCLENSMDRGAW